MDTVRRPETTSDLIDERLASLADPELADRLAEVHPDLFVTPPETPRAVVTWTARRFGIAAVALTAVASIGGGYLAGAIFDRHQARTPNAPAVTPKHAANAPKHAVAVRKAARKTPVLHRAPIAASAVVPVAVRHPAEAAVTPYAAPVVQAPAAPARATSQNAAVIAQQRAELARIEAQREREIQLYDIARRQRIAAQAAAAQTAAAQRSAANADLPAGTYRYTPQNGGATQTGSETQSSTATQTGTATQTSTATQASTVPQNGDPSTTNPQGPAQPPNGTHHHGFGMPFPIGGPVDSCSPAGGRGSILQQIIGAAVYQAINR